MDDDDQFGEEFADLPQREDDEDVDNVEIDPIDDFQLDLNDEIEESFIDKNEMGETSDDQDLLSSPSSRFSSIDISDEQEIDGFTNFNIILEYPKLNYDPTVEGPFEEELQDWFSSKDLRALRSVLLLSEDVDLDTIASDFSTTNEQALLKTVISLCYYALGSYGTAESQADLSTRIATRAAELTAHPDIIKQLAELVVSRADRLADLCNYEPASISTKTYQIWSNQFFYCLTTLHLVFLCYIKGLNEGPLPELVYETGLLTKMTKAIDRWRWVSCESEDNNPSSIIEAMSGNAEDSKKPNSTGHQPKVLSIIMSFRLRNVTILLNDLILIEFGGLQQIRSTKEFLECKFESKKPEDTDQPHEITITPLDYRHFRDDLITRYPTFTPPKYDMSQILELCLKNGEDEPDFLLSDLTSAVSILSSQGSVSSQGDGNLNNLNNLPNDPPPIHIATPLPSPRLTPQHTGGSNSSSNAAEYEHSNGEIKKKLFMTRSNFPNLYPFKDDLPVSVTEATDIFYHSIKNDFHSQQFVSTFEEFVKEEQGIKDDKFQDPYHYTEADIKANPMFEVELKSLQRVEEYYSQSLPYFSSLTYILIQLVSSNVIQLHGDKKQPRGPASYPLSPDSPGPKRPYVASQLTASEKQRLEVLRMKETALKAASSIMLLLTKWFRLSHILKSEYFTALLFDNNFISQSFRLLENNRSQSQRAKSYDFKDPDSLIYNRLVYCEYHTLYRLDDYNFYRKALSLSGSVKSPYKPEMTEQEETDTIFQFKDGNANESMLSFVLPFNAQCNISIERPNWRYCQVVSNLFRTIYGLISHYKIQRIYKMLEVRPTETLRFYLTIFNQDINKPILKIIKLMSPFSGKKWRANNMDMISFVYLFYKVGLKDNWLTNYFSGSLEQRLNVCYENEFSLRCLLKYYNVKCYHDILDKFGYSDQDIEFLRDVRKSDNEFFEAEVDKLAIEDLRQLKLDQ